MTDGKQQDVEVYALRPELPRLLAWVSAAIGDVQLVDKTDDIRIYRPPGIEVAVTVTPEVEDGPFTSVMFAGRKLPWKSDAECARDAARHLAVLVRCTPENDMGDDIWLQVEAGGERMVPWDAPVP